MHLGAKHFTNDVSPTPIHRLPSADDADDSDANNDGNFAVGDTLGKALALVIQIRRSPQACAFFKKCCKECGAPDLELLRWIRTRWASLYYFIDRLLALKFVRPQFFSELAA
jgi:hypothetical protein